MKTCNKCKETKELSLFKKKASIKSGYAATCKKCAVEYSKQHYEANKQKRLEYAQAYRENNVEKVSVAKRASYSKNRDYYSAANKRWRLENPERKAELDKQWRINNPQRRYEIEKRRRLALSGSHIDLTLLAQKIDYWGGLCWICKIKPYESIDHVKPLNKGGAHILCNLRPACKPCNSSKGDKWPIEYWAVGASQETPN